MKPEFSLLKKLISQTLPTEDPQSLLSSDRLAVLTLDRALSPAGDRRLKDARMASSLWPSPSVFRTSQLAERILKQMERKAQRPLSWPLLSAPECVDQLRTLFPERRIRNLYTRLLQFKHLHPSAVKLESWPNVLKEYEASNSLELKEWTQILLDFLRLRIRAQEMKVWISPWQVVECVIREQELLQEFSSEDWTQIFECNPLNPQPLKLLLIESREAYALEVELFRILELSKEGHFKFLRIPISEREAPSQELLNRLKSCESVAENFALYWASPEKTPSSAEVLEWIPGYNALDVASDQHASPDPRLRSFYLYAHYLAQKSPSKHPWIFERERLKEDSSAIERESEAPKIWKQITDYFQDRSDHWIHRIQSPRTEADLCDWIFVALEEGLQLNEKKASAEHPRIRSDGIPFFSIHDLLYTPEDKKVLWGNESTLEALCNPLSPDSQASPLLPNHLDACFQAEGIPIPDVQVEMRKLSEIISLASDSLWLLKAPRRPFACAEVPATALSPYPKDTLSPTAVEAYLKCPLQFYLNRVLRLQDPQLPDPERVQENLRGLWIHRVLEILLPELSPQTDAARIYKVLESTVDEIFVRRISRAYRELLLKQATLYSQQLEKHVRSFELPLLRFYPTRKLRLEDWIESRYLDQSFKGKTDRIDRVSEGSYFLWDYKTNDQKQKIATLLKNNTLQWFLYKELFESATPSSHVLGGGYLNPLNPEKSRLVVIEHADSKKLLGLLEGLDYPFEVLSEKQLNDCHSLLKEKVHGALEGIRKSDFQPRPFKESLCQFCSASGICGRPFLSEHHA